MRQARTAFERPRRGRHRRSLELVPLERKQLQAMARGLGRAADRFGCHGLTRHPERPQKAKPEGIERRGRRQIAQVARAWAAPNYD